MFPKVDLTPTRRVTPAKAVAALIYTEDDRYLLQLRDAIPTIFYPDHWGFFGGALETGESALDGLQRELKEELGIDVDQPAVRLFGQFTFTVEPLRFGALDRVYFEMRIDAAAVDRMRLGEGAAMELLDGRHALNNLRLVPYDGFALWLHCHRRNLMPPA